MNNLDILREHIAQMDVGSDPEILRTRILRRIEKIRSKRVPPFERSVEERIRQIARQVVREEVIEIVRRRCGWVLDV